LTVLFYSYAIILLAINKKTEKHNSQGKSDYVKAKMLRKDVGFLSANVNVKHRKGKKKSEMMNQVLLITSIWMPSCVYDVHINFSLFPPTL
jgi:hypothetical protein